MTKAELVLERVRAGHYRTSDDAHHLLRTDWDGPRGGTFVRWEHAVPDTFGSGLVIVGMIHCRTLRDARAELSDLLSRGETR